MSEQQISAVIRARKRESNMVNAMEVLNLLPTEIQIAHAVALEMKNRNVVKLLHSNFNAVKVVVGFTLLAYAYLPR
jgi:hypothetical protein